MGVNTPASAVIIVGLEHPGQQPYSIAEYKSLVGRDGRLGFAERGASYLIATSGNEEYHCWQRYVSGMPEDLASRFLDADPRTLIIRVLVAAGRVSEGVSGDDIIGFLESSFGVFQMQQTGNTAGWDRLALQCALDELARAVSQFGGAFDGSAGPIRSVTSRTCDVLPVIARAAELLHAGLDLQERTASLLLRLDLGIQGPVVDLARFTERALDRADYHRLCNAALTTQDALMSAENNTLLPLIGNDFRKLTALRDALEQWRQARPPLLPPVALPAYQQ